VYEAPLNLLLMGYVVDCLENNGVPQRTAQPLMDAINEELEYERQQEEKKAAKAARKKAAKEAKEQGACSRAWACRCTCHAHAHLRTHLPEFSVPQRGRRTAATAATAGVHQGHGGRVAQAAKLSRKCFWQAAFGVLRDLSESQGLQRARSQNGAELVELGGRAGRPLC
jgi:hypothetical protein